MVLHSRDLTVHIFSISNPIFLFRPLVASAREPSQVSSCLGVCQQSKSLPKSSEEKSCLFESDRQLFHSQSDK